MRDFYADHPFTEVVLKIPEPQKFCAVGDAVAGMKPESAVGRVERFVEGGILVHPTKAGDFHQGDTLVSPTGFAIISEVAAA